MSMTKAEKERFAALEKDLQREREAQSKIKRVMHAGAQMANACFNLSQRSLLGIEDRRMLSGMYQDWDRAKKC